MKTLLVLAQHPELPEAIRAAVDHEQVRVIHRLDLKEAEPFLSHALVDCCLVDVEFSNVQGMWTIEKLHRLLPKCPIIAFSGAGPWEFEEEAYLHGVTHVLTKPVRPRMLSTILARLWPHPLPPENRPAAAVAQAESPAKADDSGNSAFESLAVLRDFSAILTHSLCAEAMLKEFLLFLRELIGLNRAAIFLRSSPDVFGDGDGLQENRRLRSAFAIGISSNLLEHFELSFEAGLGGYLYRHGRILRRDSDPAKSDVEVQKEFELMGAEVAVPILDREALIGVAVFGGRVTGESLTNSELELIFHLLEELGMAIKNIWLHDQLSANHEMMADILRQLSSACIVVGRDLSIMHANKTARKFFGKGGARNSEFEFGDLPQNLASKIYQVLKTGSGISPFKYEPEDGSNAIFQVTILPFQPKETSLPNSALLLVEDHSQSEQLKQLELEAANVRLIRTMADRMSHEINNALVPLSTHQQLLNDRYKDPEFRASLETALSEGVCRVSRLINQVRFLASDLSAAKEAFPISKLIEDAFQEALRYFPTKTAQLQYEDGRHPIVLTGDRAALKHAIAEVFLNAFQANPKNATVKVRLGVEASNPGSVDVEVHDAGDGFSSEAVKRAPEAFYTTRTVGLGLGLVVSQKIVERHNGTLSIVPPGKAERRGHGVIRITLPMGSAGQRMTGLRTKEVTA